jgi:hypothetical protein
MSPANQQAPNNPPFQDFVVRASEARMSVKPAASSIVCARSDG